MLRAINVGVDYKVVTVCKRRLGTNAQHTCNIVTVALGGFPIKSIHVLNLIFIQSRAEITNLELQLQLGRKCDFNRAICTPRFYLGIISVATILADNCSNLIRVKLVAEDSENVMQAAGLDAELDCFSDSVCLYGLFGFYLWFHNGLLFNCVCRLICFENRVNTFLKKLSLN